MTLRAILFDLDDTLLGNDMNDFMSHYLPMLAEFVSPVMDSGFFVSELMAGTQAMIQNTSPTSTNRDVFWEVFSKNSGLEQSYIEPFLNRFYEQQFRNLQSITQRKATARKLIEFCFNRGLKVVIATNPLFPRMAIEERLKWAGIPVEDFEYDLVTAYENMHATKPNTAYYREILRTIDVQANRALMVGDDLENDMRPSGELGMSTFWIRNAHTQAELPHYVDEAGTLEDLSARLDAQWLQ